MGRDVQLHQALFGYDAGHHLLESSTSLPPEAVQFLAIATDLSGTAPREGFDQTITGLPLPGTQFYALFSTWLAPEMKRPGCVWSHVLLIEMPDLAGFQDLGILREQFTWPRMDRGRTSYSKPLKVRPDRAMQLTELRVSEMVYARNFMHALYVHSDKSVVVPFDSSEKAENAIFAVWSQQWPRLRRNFRFSTGSFGDRGQMDAMFDLQVTPSENLRVWPREEGFLVFDTDFGSPIIDLPSWLHAAVRDLSKPISSSQLRQFLRAYGADVTEPRLAFAKLANWFSILGEKVMPSWCEVLDGVALDFPDANDALTLKRCVASSVSDGPVDAHSDRVWHSFHRVFLAGPSDAFGKVEFDYRSAVRSIWPTKRKEIAELLVARPNFSKEERWSAVAVAVAETIDGEDLGWLWDNYPDLLPALVRSRPQLASKQAIWRLDERAQWRVVDALESLSPLGEYFGEVVSAMLASGTHVAVREIASMAGEAAFQANLFWTKFKNALPPIFWREALSDIARFKISGQDLNPEELAFCLTLLPLREIDQLVVTRNDVSALVSTPLESLPQALRLPGAFFLVALGLKGSGPVSAAALGHGFFSTHRALATQTEPSEFWRLLQRRLPPFRFWEWDRCDKLRTAVRDWLRANRAEATFINAARSNDDRELARFVVQMN